MPNAQNGWPVITDTPWGRQQLDTDPLIPGIVVPNGVLAGPVAVIFRWLATEYNRRVETLIPGQCWGWFVKRIAGSDVWSNHAAGCAVDFNAPANPMGSGTTAKSLTPEQISQCHRIERMSEGVLRWGGDFSRNDPMHWEIIGTPRMVAEFAARIEGDTMPSAEDIAKAVWSYDADKATPGTQTAGGLLLTENRRSNATTNQDVPALRAEVRDLKAMVQELTGITSAILLKLSAPPEDTPV